MSQLTDQNQVGQKEQVADWLVNVDQKATPFTTLARKKSCHNFLIEGSADRYADPDSTGVGESEDVATLENAYANEGLIYGRVQRLRRTASVSDALDDAVDTYSRGKNAMARSKAKKLVELKRDIETMALGHQDQRAESGAIKAQARGMIQWANPSPQSTEPVPDDYRPAAAQTYSGAALAAFDEDDLYALLESAYTAAGETITYDVFAGIALKRQVSTFTTYVSDQASHTFARRFNDQADKEISIVVDLVENDAGTWRMHTSNFIGYEPGDNQTYDLAARSRLGVAIDMSKVYLFTLRAPRFKDLPNQGGGQKAYVDAYMGTLVTNPLTMQRVIPNGA